MPALVVWERLITGGDDLRIVTATTFVLRIFQVSTIIYLLHHIMRFDHDPTIFILAGCLSDEARYWMWYNASLAGCFVTLACGLVGVCIEVAMFKISGRGTPAQTEARRRLVPLCKFNMVPMLVVRTAGFVFAVSALALTERFCSCALNNVPEEYLEEEGGSSSSRRSYDATLCPIQTRSWHVTARLLIFTMAWDTIIPAITLIVVLRKRIVKFYRRLRPARERELEDVERSYANMCRRCCECSSLVTCYMFGGQKLTAGSYADVAIALTDFLEGDGALDIVPSDVAAALICLVNSQKQKQIECKNELLREGGIFAKDRRLAKRLWRQFVDSNSTTAKGPRNFIGKPEMPVISCALKRSLSLSKDSLMNGEGVEAGLVRNSGDIEAGCASENECSHPLDVVVLRPQEGEEKEAAASDQEADEGPSSGEQLEPTNKDFEHLRQMILTRRSTMQRLEFSLIHKNGSLTFEPKISKILSPQRSLDCLVLGEGSRYCAVALASYSWMMYLWTNKCTGCCRLTMSSLCGACTCNPRCSCCHSNDDVGGGDICGWKQATVLKSLGIEESDLVYANFSNDVSVNPYLILRDREWKTIVLAIRGTLSFEDMISDVTISPQSLEEVGEQFGFDGRGEYCHSGMLAGANWIFDDLKKHKKLDEVMEANPDFGLRIIGHSLGAGVAAMLGLMLRQQYPKLHCLCFSPPGCVFSERTAKDSEDFVYSYVLHNDIVPRLSYDSLVNLRNDLIEMIARIKVPKHEVFDSNWSFRSEKNAEETVSRLLHCSEEIPASPFYAEFEQFKERRNQRQKERHRSRIKMTVPGRIVQMLRISTKLDNKPCSCLLSCAKCICCCDDNKKYKIRWIDAQDLSEIYISPTMTVDHFPYNVARALDVAAETYGVDDQVPDMHGGDQLERITEGAKKDS